MEKYTWDVFVSHNSVQKPWVRQMVQQWVGLGLHVFFDEHNIEPGEDIVAGIERGLLDSRHVVLVISPSAVTSRWVAMESACTLYQDPDSSKRRIIPILLEPTPRDSIRLAVQHLRMIDLTDSSQQVANYHRLLRFLGVRTDPLPAPPLLGELSNASPDGEDCELDWAPHSEQDADSGAVATGTRVWHVEIRIDRPFDDFTLEDRERLLKDIGEILEVTGKITVVSQHPGSVLLTICLRPDKAERLTYLAKSGVLEEHKVIDARILRASTSAQPRTGHSEPTPIRKKAAPTKLRKQQERIRQDLNKPQTYCFVGAGLSIAAGIVGWKDLLQHMGEQLENQFDLSHEQFKNQLKEGLFAQAGDTWKRSQITDKDKQTLLIHKCLEEGSPTPIHRQIIRLGARGIFTTNYDHLLENTYARHRHEVPLIYTREQLAQEGFQFHEKFFVAKLHGDAADWRNVVIGLDDLNSATWAETVKSHLRDATLLVFGVGGWDHIVNEFLLQLDRTKVHFIADPRTLKEVKGFYKQRTGRYPAHMHFVPVHHSRLSTFLREICPEYSAAQVHDTPWGRMPSPRTHLVFDKADESIQQFLHGETRIARVTGNPGSGVSSFVAQILTELTNRGDCAVIRQEAKRWLPLEAYVLHLLTYKNLADVYNKVRHGETEGWADENEAAAIADCLNTMDVPVYIAVEHADRLDQRSCTFWETVAGSIQDHVKLIFVSTAPPNLRVQADTTITLEHPNTQARVDLFAKWSALQDRESAENALKDLAPETLHDLIFSAVLLRDGQHVDKVREAMESGLQNLCAMVIDVATKNRSDTAAIRVLQACAVFRTARTAESLLASLDSPSSVNIAKVEEVLGRFCRHGLLIPIAPPAHGPAQYGMSSTVCALVDKDVNADENQRKRLSKAVGDVFRDRALSIVHDSHANQRDHLSAIPDVATGLFHYEEGQCRAAYADLIDQIRSHILDTYHFGVLEDWLAREIVEHRDAQRLDRADFLFSYTKARVARVGSYLEEFKVYLHEARKAIQQMQGRGEPCGDDANRLRLEEGILSATRRDYAEALRVFKQDLGDRNDPKRREGLIQTFLSLGRLRDAEIELDALTANIAERQRKPREEYRPNHDLAMLHRHRSTLCSLRLLLYAYRPEGVNVSKEKLYTEAVNEGNRCIDFSRMGEPQGIVDEMGVGIGTLKRGLARYAYRQYSQGAADAQESSIILASYPNSLWWRMCCYDLEARCLAMCGDFDKAERLVERAEHVFHEVMESESNDWVRWCEFRRTRGLILLQQDRPDDAIPCLRESLAFCDERGLVSPCIEAAHRADLVRALLLAGEPDLCLENLRRLKEVDITW